MFANATIPIPPGSIAPITAAEVVVADRAKRARLTSPPPDAECMLVANYVLDFCIRDIIENRRVETRDGRYDFDYTIRFNDKTVICMFYEPFSTQVPISPNHFLRAIISRPQFVDYRVDFYKLRNPGHNFTFKLNHAEFCVLAIESRVIQDVLRKVFSFLKVV